MSAPFAQQNKQNILTIIGTGVNGADRSDGVVPVPSAALSDPNIRARYVNRKHAQSIAKIDTAEHESFKLVKSFLLASDLLSSTSDDCTLPACRENLGDDFRGLIVMRPTNAESGKAIKSNQGVIRVQFDPPLPVLGSSIDCPRLSGISGCDLNSQTSV